MPPWTLYAVATIAFTVGFGVGFYAAVLMDDPSKREVRLYISIFVTLVWGVSIVSGIILGDAYTPSWALHAMMGAVAGFFFKSSEPVDTIRGGSS